MKNKLLLFLFTAIPFAMHSQAVFYNKGAMCVVAQDTTKTTLYINGDFVAATDADDNTITSKILVKNSRVVLTGDFKNNVTEGTVFIRPAAADEGLFEFRSNVAQAITTDGTTYATIPSKKTSYIDFPNLQINNSKHVTMSPELAAKTKDIALTKGWLILDSKRVEEKDYDGPLTEDLKNNRTVMAHLLVDGAVNYQNWTATDPNERGFIEVNMKLDPWKSTNKTERKSMTGFGIPFEQMGADYFMWNLLLSPTNLNYWGNKEKRPITDPKTILKAGKGYATTIDVRGAKEADYYGDLRPEYEGTIEFDQRAKDGHYFNRFRFATDATRKSNQVFGTDQTSTGYTMEKLNVSDVKVNLEKGYNYLANPFMSPLSITELLAEGTSGANWGLVADGSANTNRDLMNRVWILKGDAASYTTTFENNIGVVYNYYLAKNVGGTYTDEYDDGDYGVTIAPLQMFLVNAVKAGQITIPKNQRTMSGAKFIRSTQNKRQDDFIIEVIDENTRMSDRTSFVLRSQEELDSNKNLLNIKRLSTASVSTASETQTSTVVSEGPVDQNIFNQIYTMDNSGNALVLRFLPLDTESVNLYMTPALEAQDITLRGLRLNTKDKVGNIWLEDKLENKTVELTPQTLYQTRSLPDDPIDRFVLHFKYGSSIDPEVNDGRAITAYYDNSTLTVRGFVTTDLGSKIYLYNMQGHLVKQANVDDLTVTIPCSLTPGAYIVKTTCEKSNVTKLLVK